jgi:hypothetical protein
MLASDQLFSYRPRLEWLASQAAQVGGMWRPPRYGKLGGGTRGAPRAVIDNQESH